MANAFRTILLGWGEWRSSIGGMTFDSLPSVDVDGLETPFSKEEILVGLSNLSGDKVLGLDGFTMTFLKFC